MTARTIAAIVALAFAVLTACGDGITAPGTGSASIQVTNDSGFDQLVKVRLGPCDARLETVASLQPGEGHVAVVDPGCWRIAVYATAPHGSTTTLCGTRFDVRAGETVRLRF